MSSTRHCNDVLRPLGGGYALDARKGQTGGRGLRDVPVRQLQDQRNAGAELGLPFGFTDLIAHGVAHALAATGSCAARHSDGHVDDSRQDILYAGPLGLDHTELRLDVGRDDYYTHSIPGCPDIENSPLLLRRPQCPIHPASPLH
jgi:hypothetical protein